MICEYSAAAAVAELHQRSLPAGMAWTTLSLGHEDGASFATQSANAAREAVTPFRAVLSAELTVPPGPYGSPVGRARDSETRRPPCSEICSTPS